MPYAKLEFDASRKLNCPRRSHGVCPCSKRSAGAGYVCLEGHGRTAVVAALRRKEVVVVECVEEISFKSKVDLFRDSRVLGKGHVQVLVAGPVNSGHGFSRAGVTERTKVGFIGIEIEVSASL